MSVIMDVKQEKLCRLCLKTGELEVIEESTKDLFDALLLNIDFTVTEQPTICDACACNLRKSFDFKAVYMSAEERVMSFLKSENTQTVDLKRIYSNDASFISDSLYTVCRLCIQHVNKDLCKSLDFKGSLTVYIPEIDLTATEMPVVCPQCWELLQDYINFRTSCWRIEERIKEYSRVSGKLDISLSDVARFVLPCEVLIKNEGSLEKLVEVKEETEEQEIYIKKEADESSADACIEPEHNPNASSATFAILKCPQCMYETKYPQQLARHVFTHKLYTCKPCSFETKVKYNLTRHLTTSKCLNVYPPEANITYKCEICAYETKQQTELDEHMETHKPSEDETLFKCNSCTFKTKRIFNYNRHVIRHLPSSQVDMFVCEFCAFQTIEKGVLVRHMLTHKSRSEMKLYKCETCAYEAKHRYRLKRHELTHTNNPDGRWYHCAYCDFKSKERYSQTVHLATHKTANSLAVPIYDCDKCAYQTKRMEHLRRHQFVHRDPSEVAWFKCDECDFETTQKMYLVRHAKNHKRESGERVDVMHECDVCDYKTRQKCHLKRHKISHSKSRVKK